MLPTDFKCISHFVHSLSLLGLKIFTTHSEGLRHFHVSFRSTQKRAPKYAGVRPRADGTRRWRLCTTRPPGCQSWDCEGYWGYVQRLAAYIRLNRVKYLVYSRDTVGNPRMKSPLSPGGLVHCQTEAFSHQPSAISYRLTTCTDIPIRMRDRWRRAREGAREPPHAEERGQGTYFPHWGRAREGARVPPSPFAAPEPGVEQVPHGVAEHV